MLHIEISQITIIFLSGVKKDIVNEEGCHFRTDNKIVRGLHYIVGSLKSIKEYKNDNTKY